MTCRTAIAEYVENRRVGGFQLSEGFTVSDVVKWSGYADSTVRGVLWDMVKNEWLHRGYTPIGFKYYTTNKWAQ